jgi:hypothetical protein
VSLLAGEPVSACVLVVCRECNGARSNADGTACGHCLAQGHVAVDRTPDGDVPIGETEWIRPTLPDRIPPWRCTHGRCIP